jgi:hypothetical protein
MNNSKLLIDDQPLLILPKLVEKIGFNEAIVLQQIHYWITLYQEAYEEKGLYKDHIHDGRMWIYNSVRNWVKDNFTDVMSERTLWKVMANLEGKGKSEKCKMIKPLIVCGNYNKRGYDKTKWYTIDYDAVNELMGATNMQKLQKDTEEVAEPIPENTSYININGFQTETQQVDSEEMLGQQEEISLGGFIPINSPADYAYNFYLSYYYSLFGFEHMLLSEGVKDSVIYKLQNFQNKYDLTNEDWVNMISKYFKTKFSKKVDYNILHFVSGKIIENRYLETVYKNDNQSFLAQ